MSWVGWTGSKAGGSKHSDKGGGGGWGLKKKNFFSALRASVWSKNKRGGGGPGPSPGSAAEMQLYGTLLLCLV